MTVVSVTLAHLSEEYLLFQSNDCHKCLNNRLASFCNTTKFRCKRCSQLIKCCPHYRNNLLGYRPRAYEVFMEGILLRIIRYENLESSRYKNNSVYLNTYQLNRFSRKHFYQIVSTFLSTKKKTLYSSVL